MVFFRLTLFFIFLAGSQAKTCLQLITADSDSWSKSNLESKISFDLISQSSRGVASLDYLFDAVDFKDSGFSLGLGAGSELTNLSKSLGLVPPSEGHKLLFGTYDAQNIADYMDFITRGSRPVVFFVPENFFNYQMGFSEHGDLYATEQEFDWLMKNPERKKNVYFVLEAYGTRHVAKIVRRKRDFVSNENAKQQIEAEMRRENLERRRRQRQIELDALQRQTPAFFSP